MKQLLTNYEPIFNPTDKTLDFSTVPGFAINKLYAVINVTQNVPIYIAGAPGLGITSSSNAGTLLTLQYSTTAHSSTDQLNVFYDFAPGYESNTPLENGGNLEKMSYLMQYMLTELKVLNYQMQLLLSGPTNAQNTSDLEDLRRSTKDPGDFEDMGNVN